VRGGFFVDSVSIGEHLRYFLVASYPSDLTIIFPDSTYDYKPFEFEKKQYFATETTDSLSYDSVIYNLSTFEIEPVQYLSLPVFVINKMDSTSYHAKTDSILLHQLVKSVPDSLSADKLPLKMNTAYQRVPYLFNYPILIIVVGALVVIAAVGWFVFGKRIRKYYRVKRLNKNYQQFQLKYGAYLDEVRKAFTVTTAEATVTTWKNYMEQLEGRPYTKLTTREVLRMENDHDLGVSLTTIDKAIYGHEAFVVLPLEKLRDYAARKFLKKLEEVKHGK
jgi:hypothetical protein